MERRTIRCSMAALVFGLTTAGTACAAPKRQAIELAVTEKGFEPAAVTVQKGKPVTLVVTRKTEKTCATEIVIDEHAINTNLPLNKPVTITFTPKKTGDLKYGCAMNKMVGGVLRVE